MPIGDRLRHRRHGGRRLVLFGDQFTSEELAADEVELDLPRPSRAPADDQQAEPWNASPGDDRFRDRERAYREFLEQRRRDHPEEWRGES